MLLKINSRIRQVGTFLRVSPKKFHIIFRESSECFFLNPGMALNWTDSLDMQELDIILQILKISGNGWQDELLGKKACLIVECKEDKNGKLGVEIKAIGRPEKKHKRTKEKFISDTNDTNDTAEKKDDIDGLFLVLNSGVQLVSEERAMELITEEAFKENSNQK